MEHVAHIYTHIYHSQVPEGSGEQGKIEEIGCEIICGAPTTLAVKGLMMMIMMMIIIMMRDRQYG